jgi:iron(III) transport system permease protein
MAFPNIVLAVAAVLAWNRAPLRVYGTPWAIILTYMVLFIPIVMKQVTGLIQHYDTRLLAAARLSGASPLQSFMTITLPILAPGLKSGFIICFLIALREIPISQMLYFSGQETVGVLLFGMHSQSYGLEMTSALSMVIIFLLFIGNIIIKRITRKHTYGKTAHKEHL